MSEAVHGSVRDVILLMMVRVMPEDDFTRLCDNVLKGELNTLAAPIDSVPYCPLLSPSDPSRPDLCDCCGDRIEPSTETANFAAATGLPACKACVDAMLGAVFGPNDERQRIAAAAFDLMATHAA